MILMRIAKMMGVGLALMVFNAGQSFGDGEKPLHEENAIDLTSSLSSTDPIAKEKMDRLDKKTDDRDIKILDNNHELYGPLSVVYGVLGITILIIYHLTPFAAIPFGLCCLCGLALYCDL